MTALLALCGLAAAYEVDPWSGRDQPLAPADMLADAKLNAALDAAANRVSRRCPRDPVRMQDALARAVFHETGRRSRPEDLPWRRSFGHGVYSGWLEVGPVDRVDGGTGIGVFTGLGLLESPVLAWAGTASTVMLGGERVGTDKVDHFLAIGYRYWRWSRHGGELERAVRRGTTTERLFFGRLTSNAFSYADLAANLDGYRFYASLAAASFAPDPDGCVMRADDFQWSGHVDPSWDELANPTAYGPRVARQIATNLDDDREALCAAFAAIRPAARPEAVAGRAPAVAGPLGLGAFCVDPPQAAEATRVRSRADSHGSGG
ncbi:MAG: hypothetical protein ACI8PZ_003635 [Myxococcota bacterium]|jgi:hypothetical protein